MWIPFLGDSQAEPFQYIDPANPLCSTKACETVAFSSGGMGVVTACPNECYVGVAMDVLREAAAELSKQHGSFIFDVDHTTTKKYTPVLRTFVERGDYDIAVGDWTATSQRAQWLGVPYSYYDLGLALLRTKAIAIVTISDSAWAFLAPFTTQAWLAICVHIFLSAFWFWFYEHGNNDDVPDAHCPSFCHPSSGGVQQAREHTTDSVLRSHHNRFKMRANFSGVTNARVS